MGRKTPPFKNNPDITEAKFRSIVTSALRNSSRWWKPMLKAKEKACVGIRKNKKTGKRCKHYKCVKCNNLFIAKDIQMDHIESIIPLDGFSTWDEYILRMFAPEEAYQAMCKECHKEKTLKERQLKREYELKRRNDANEAR